MSDINKKNDKDLHKLLAEKRVALREFRFGLSGSKVRNIKEGRNLRREIAQILTEVTSRK
jgi:ribosomal protein L29